MFSRIVLLHFLRNNISTVVDYFRVTLIDVIANQGRRQTEKASAADYLKHYDAVNRLSRNFQTEQSFVDAASEKEQVGYTLLLMFL